uniref:Prefoldin subunit 1 n=1 Tax=Parastrongyloides trichosuri TaxID=131310 RepID=A0A0N5A1X2_PARTI
MSSEFDTQLRQAFQDLHVKLAENTTQIKATDQMLQQAKHELRLDSLVKAQILDIGNKKPIYRCIGRAYQIDDYDKAIERLTESIKTNEERTKALETKKKYLEKVVEDAEKNVRELIQSRK